MFHFDTSVLAKEALLMRARRFFSGTKKTILLPMAGRLYGVDIQEGKFLRFASVPFPHDKEPEKIAEALEALAEKGIRGKSLMLIAMSRDLRTKVLNLPEMDEDEMHESLSWKRTGYSPVMSRSGPVFASSRTRRRPGTSSFLLSMKSRSRAG